MTSYRQIFKSTVLIGGTQVINIMIGIFRTKFLAVLLGPSGVGLASMYQSTVGLVGNVTGFGIARSGVRQVAEANGMGDEIKIALTCKTLRQSSLVCGFLGMFLILLFCIPIARATFGSSEYFWGVATVSLVLLFDTISAGQKAVLQGMRRVKELAICQILGAVFGLAASISIVYFWRERGIAWYLVAIAAFGILTSWWYVRKVGVKSFEASKGRLIAETRVLFKLGASFMVSGVIGTGTMYLTRVLVIRGLGVEAVGLYTAVVTLSSIYVNMILNAMSADYYPRLTAVSGDHQAASQMVNEQLEMGLLLAMPGIIGTLTLAPWVLKLFYTEAFATAAIIIRWQILGVALRVLSWPLGIIMLAKGLPRLLIISESIVALAQICFLIICMKMWGLEGTGIAFLLSYIVHATVVYGIAKKTIGFCWSRKSLLIMGISGTIIAFIFLAIYYFPMKNTPFLGVLTTIIVSVFCLLGIKKELKAHLY